MTQYEKEYTTVSLVFHNLHWFESYYNLKNEENIFCCYLWTPDFCYPQVLFELALIFLLFYLTVIRITRFVPRRSQFRSDECGKHPGGDESGQDLEHERWQNQRIYFEASFMEGESRKVASKIVPIKFLIDCW